MPSLPFTSNVAKEKFLANVEASKKFITAGDIIQVVGSQRFSVEGQLSADKTNYDLMRATFPAGTVSGVPKIRAMQIIADLEGTTRGPYGGCVGYFSFNGNLDTCITIRTALLKDGKAYAQAGGGWVNDSEPEAEFQETVNKSKAMLKAVALAESFAKG